jgi:hypothetical protein
MIEPPARLRSRPRDARGFVIPWTQFIRKDGTPDFRVLDHERVGRALRIRLCSMCRGSMGRHIFFIGGPLCVANGYFYDPPMHRECALYALQTCPHLARAKGRYVEPATVAQAIGAEARLIVGDMAPEKAEWFGLMHTTDYTFGRDAKGMLIIKAKLPWLDVERWRSGEMFHD